MGRVRKKTRLDYRILLNPLKETIKIRDGERDSRDFMGEEFIQEHIDYIASNPFFDKFIKIDSYEQAVDETVKEILGIINIGF